MNGGVDSSVAALFKEAGHDATGVTTGLYDNDTIGSDATYAALRKYK